MPLIDLKKKYEALYKAPWKHPVIVDVPRIKYLMVDGEGHPDNNAEFSQAMEALFSAAYTMKFTSKFGPAKLDWNMLPPEGLWWIEGGKPFDAAPKSAWRWTLMLAQPDKVNAAMLRQAKTAIKEKKKGKAPALLDKVRLRSLRQGKSAQIMHIGPYDAEKPAVDKLLAFAAGEGYEAVKLHHEIYFSDPRRSKPEKMRTLIRFQLKKAR
jgi:hypothetical protein